MMKISRALLYPGVEVTTMHPKKKTQKSNNPLTIQAYPAFGIYVSFDEDDPDALALESGDVCYVANQELAEQACTRADADGEDEESPFYRFKQMCNVTAKSFDIEFRPVLLKGPEEILKTFKEVEEFFSSSDSDDEDSDDDN